VNNVTALMAIYTPRDSGNHLFWAQPRWTAASC